MNRFALWWSTTPAPLRWLVAAIGGLYALFLVLTLAGSLGSPSVGPLFDLLVFEPGRPHYVWTFLTHPFVFPVLGFFALLSVVFGGLFLMTLGRQAIDLLGERWLVGALVAATLGASLFTFATHAATGQPTAVFGPWSLVLGLAMALGVRHPHLTIALMFVGAVRLVILVPVLVLLGALLSGSFVSSLAEIGAALGGALFAAVGRASVGLPQRTRRVPSTPPRSAASSSETGRSRAARSARTASSDIDRILDKISASGLGSLTPEERRTLDDASRS